MFEGNTVEFERALEITTSLENICLITGEEDTEIDGKTFLSSNFTIGDREEKADSSVSSISLTISNGSLHYSNLIAQNGNIFTGAEIKLYYYAEETLVEEFKGVIESIEMTANSFNVTINEVLNFKDSVPILTFSSTCNLRFKGKGCGYTGTDTYCRHTYSDCKEKGNKENFGGFPATALVASNGMILS